MNYALDHRHVGMSSANRYDMDGRHASSHQNIHTHTHTRAARLHTNALFPFNYHHIITIIIIIITKFVGSANAQAGAKPQRND